MKSAKQIVLGMVLMVVSLSTLLAQSQTTPPIPAVTLTIEQDIKSTQPDLGQTTYNTSSGRPHDIGRADISNYYLRFRTRLFFAFSQIPQGARVNSCTLTVTIMNYNSGSSTAKIVKMPASYGTDTEFWSQFDNSQTIYFSGLQYSQMSAKPLTSSTLTTDVQGAVNGNGSLTLGIAGLNEETDNTSASVIISMTINYTPKVTVTILNSFGGGQIDVDGTNRNSGWSSTSPQWYSGESHTIRAYTQPSGGLTYPFPAPGTWTNITTGETKPQTNNNSPATITPTNDCTWRANFGQGTIQATVYQKFSTGSSTGGTIGHWEGGPNFASYNVGTPVPLSVGSQALLGTQRILFNGSNYSIEKYYKWTKPTGDEPDVLNHHVFTVGSGFPNNLTSQFNVTTNGPSVTVGLPEGPATFNSPTVQFADPWYINYPDPSYNGNLRNQGINASPISRSAPFTPDYYNTFDGNNTYKGVFLNQNSLFDPTKPIYSVVAPPTQSITANGQSTQANFYNWTVSTNAGWVSQPMSATSPVVFSASSSVVTANYKGIHVSSNASTFSNNSQRKLVRTRDGWLHQVYESLGRVWLEESTDNGSSWTVGNGGQPLDNGAGKCPSIDWHYNVADPTNPNLNAVVVTFQQKSGSTYTIPYAIFKYTNGSYVYQGQNFSGPLYTEPAGGDQYASTNANPNIAWGKYYYFALTFERKSTSGTMQPGIYWMYGFMYESGVQPNPFFPPLPKCTDPILVSGTTSSSINATLSLNKLSTSYSNFDVVYQ